MSAGQVQALPAETVFGQALGVLADTLTALPQMSPAAARERAPSEVLARPSGLKERASPPPNRRSEEPIEVLERLLTCLVGKRGARPAAERMLARFGSLASVLASPPRELARSLDGNLDYADHLNSIHQAIVTVLREPLMNRTPITSWNELTAYLSVALAHSTVESVRLLHLDKKNRLILDELHSQGTVDHVPLYPRKVVERVIDVGSAALILVHNHPSGDPTPSSADIKITNELVIILAAMSIPLHDHVIVGRARYRSLAAERLIERDPETVLARLRYSASVGQ